MTTPVRRAPRNRQRSQPLFHGLGLIAAALTFGAGLRAGAAASTVAALLPASAERATTRTDAFSTYALPIGPWEDGSMLTRRAEGQVALSSWRMPDAEGGTYGLFSPLRDALDRQGWRILYECETQSCGGFDFRYSTQVLPEPAMHVDLGDFRFLSARRSDAAGEQVLSLLVSRSAGSGLGYVQAIEVAPADPAQTTPDRVLTTTSSKAPQNADLASFSAALERGSLVLEGVSFASGSTTLEDQGGEVLQDLAAYLLAHPQRQVALVGHTDASGNLEANVSLSKRRAEAVRTRLIAEYKIDGSRVSALGAGFMAPRAPNLTEEGRAQNRRVEVVLTSTQ